MTSRSKKYCTCASCLNELLPEEKTITCSRAQCKKVYHMDICIGENAPSSEHAFSWICPKCRCEAKKGGDNSSTPARGMPQKPESDNVTQRAKKNLPPSDLQTLTSEIRCLRGEVAGFKGDITGFKDSMETSSTKFEERIEELIKLLTATDERIANMEARYDAENATLRQRVTSLEEQINYQAQAALRNEIEIIGLPEMSSENLHHVALVAANKVGVDIKETDIDWVERAGPKRSQPTQSGDAGPSTYSRPVVIRLTQRAKRDAFLKAAKSRKTINAKDLGVGDKPLKVFFNERLTRQNRLLFREARSRAAAAGYRYCWTNYGHINIRKREGSAPIQIRSIAELDEKLGKGQINKSKLDAALDRL